MAKNENSEAAAPSRVGVWFQHYVHSVVFSLGRACRKPWATLLTVMVMALSPWLRVGFSESRLLCCCYQFYYLFI